MRPKPLDQRCPVCRRFMPPKRVTACMAAHAARAATPRKRAPRKRTVPLSSLPKGETGVRRYFPAAVQDALLAAVEAGMVEIDIIRQYGVADHTSLRRAVWDARERRAKQRIAQLTPDRRIPPPCEFCGPRCLNPQLCSRKRNAARQTEKMRQSGPTLGRM